MNTNETDKLILQYNKLLKGNEYGKKHALINITTHTNLLEGCSMTEYQVFQLLEQDKTSNVRSFSEHLMTFDFMNALQFVISASRLERPITPELMKQVASLAMKNTGKLIITNYGDFHTANGEYRKMPFRHVSHICPDPQLITRLILSLCDDVNQGIATALTTEQKLKVAFNLNLAILNIQPFGEGNLRVAVLMMNYVLGLFKIPMSIIFKYDEERFYYYLELIRRTGSPEPLQRFFNSQLAKFLRLEIKVLETGKAR